MAGLMAFPRGGNGLLARAPYRTQDPLMTMMLDRALMQPQRAAPAPAEYKTQDPMMTRMLEQERRQPARAPVAAMPAGTQAAPGGAVAAPGGRPGRGRVSGWRLLDRVLGGQTITEGLDEERARLETEARRPQMEADRDRIQRLVSTLPPDAQIAYALNPEKFGEALASNSEAYTLGAGGVRGGINGIAASAPTTNVVNDQIYSTDPGTRETRLIATAAPGYDDVIARDRINLDRALGEARVEIDRGALDVTRQNANRPQAVNTPTGTVTSLINPDGSFGGAIQGRETPVTAPGANGAVIDLQTRLDSTRREVLPTSTRMRELLSSGDVITGFGADARLDAARALALTGNADARRQVAATQTYQNLAGALRVGMAKSLGTNPSNADILLLKEITAGTIGQDAAALMNTVRMAESRAGELITDVERQISAARPVAPAARAVTSQPPAPRAAAPAVRTGGGRAGPIATNPTTGARVQWNGSAWVPL